VNVGVAGDTDIDLHVDTTAGCAWTAASQVGWIAIRSGASGTGDGHVHITVTANADLSSRAGTLLIGGQTVTVNQAGLVVGQDVTITGTIAALSGACPARQFTMAGRTVVTTAATTYGKNNCGDLRDGRSAKVEGRIQPDGSIMATKIDKIEGLTAPSIEVAR
jgi:hypothetical protein